MRVVASHATEDSTETHQHEQESASQCQIQSHANKNNIKPENKSNVKTYNIKSVIPSLSGGYQVLVLGWCEVVKRERTLKHQS